MAAPTSVRIEAINRGTAILRWAYSGLNNITVYRALASAGPYTQIHTASAVTTDFTDDTLSDATRYFYKLSDDGGSTFSSIVSVVSYVNPTPHFDGNPGMSMPTPIDGEGFREHLQQFQNKEQLANTPCDVCIQNGAIVLDCSSGCQFFRVIVDQDINSISLVGCEECPFCDFVIPPDEEHGICGWPIGCQYTWDECFEAPVSGGDLGRVAKTNGLSYGGYGQPGPRGPNQSCPCPAEMGAGQPVSIVCCDDGEAVSCEVDCGTSVRLKACGGLAPYTWSSSGNITLSNSTGGATTATSTQSAGGGGGGSVAGVWKFTVRVSHFNTLCDNQQVCVVPHPASPDKCEVSVTGKLIAFNCDGSPAGEYWPFAIEHPIGSSSVRSGVLTVTGGEVISEHLDDSTSWQLFSFRCHSNVLTATVRYTVTPAGQNGINGTVWAGAATFDSGAVSLAETGFFNPSGCSQAQTEAQTAPGFIDVRTQAMVDAGCGGGGCSQGLTTVTVTDAAGQSATVILHS